MPTLARGANSKKKPKKYGKKRVSKLRRKPLSPNGRNNGSQAHEINKWVLKR